jgi:hypothetical protein
MGTLLHDLRYGLRTWAKNPSSTAWGACQLLLGSNITSLLKQER